MEIAYLKGNDGKAIVALGNEDQLILRGGELASIDSFLEKHKGDWIFTALSYDLKVSLHHMSSSNPDRIHFPDAVFFVPKIVVQVENGKLNYRKGSADPETNALLAKLIDPDFQKEGLSKELLPTTSRAAYIEHVQALQDELQYGNIYEINYCQEFFTEGIQIKDEINFFKTLDSYTETPFAAYLRLPDFSVFCASPERFLKKEGKRLLSQPIKGTIKRGKTEAEDETLKAQLFNDPKERSENVMIVDLVRNDLSLLATRGSVHVDELFGIYSFKTVHQMISTVSCELKDQLSFTDILRATFPMGSMTGAPKRSAMQLIEAHEDFKRGLYSGSIGYIDPEGNFDLNVVIRTLIYNRNNASIHCPVGSAITIQANAEYEYEECKLKIHSFLDRLVIDHDRAE